MSLETRAGEVVVLAERDLLERLVATEHVLDRRRIGKVEARTVEGLEVLEVARDKLEGPGVGVATGIRSRLVTLVFVTRGPMPALLIIISVPVCAGCRRSIISVKNIARISTQNENYAIVARSREVAHIEIYVSIVIKVGSSHVFFVYRHCRECSTYR